MWNCVLVGMAQIKQVARGGRRAWRWLRSSPTASLKCAARCAASEPPATGTRAFHIKPLRLWRQGAREREAAVDPLRELLLRRHVVRVDPEPARHLAAAHLHQAGGRLAEERLR